MLLSPSSFSYEQLSSLKFKELQKLSTQFGVNKRWAKKQELIGNLLGLKEKGKLQSEDKQEENEWRDGSVVFSDVKENNKNEVDRRLTFNVNTKSDSDCRDRRLTFVLPQNEKDGKKLGESIISRETYVFDKRTDFGVEPLAEARATFELPPKTDLMPQIDPRATFEIPQNGNGLLKDVQPSLNKNKHDKPIQNLKKDTEIKMKTTSAVKKDTGDAKYNISKQNVDKEKDKEGKLQVKTLTIPYARVTRRNRKEASKADNSPIKMSKKSINIKKSTLSVRKNNLIKSPTLSSVKKPVQKQTIIQSLVENHSGRITQSKVPVRQLFSGEKPKVDKQTSEKVKDENKENVKRSLIRMSKSGDEDVSKKLSSVKGNFRMHCGTRIPLRTDLTGRLSVNATATPGGCKPAVKPSTVTKMPDFNKIHKRHFEQMDSLPDYLKKKEERVRKLFGIPQPGQQLQATPVFRFQSVAVEKGIKGSAVKSLAAPLRQRQTDSKVPQKEAFKSKLPPSKLRADIKEENRNHIRGVRTNKRFELQMKLRNM